MSLLTAVTLLGLASTAPSGVESLSTLSLRQNGVGSPLLRKTSTKTKSSQQRIFLPNFHDRRISLPSSSATSAAGASSTSSTTSSRFTSSSRLFMGVSDFSSHPYSTYYGTSGSTAKQNFQQNDEMNDVYGYDDDRRGLEQQQQRIESQI